MRKLSKKAELSQFLPKNNSDTDNSDFEDDGESVHELKKNICSS